jgi:hypothetical protein
MDIGPLDLEVVCKVNDDMIAGLNSQKWPRIADHWRVFASSVFATIGQAVVGRTTTIGRGRKYGPIGVVAVVGCRHIQGEYAVDAAKFGQV